MTETNRPLPTSRASRDTHRRALAVTYTARRGRRHTVLIGVDSAGEWAVYDIPTAGRAKTGKVVQVFPDHRDGIRQAIALQADYAAMQDAYQAGRREYNPLAKFTRQAVTRITEHADRAVNLALTQASAEKDTELVDRLLALTGEQPASDAAKAA